MITFKQEIDENAPAIQIPVSYPSIIHYAEWGSDSNSGTRKYPLRNRGYAVGLAKDGDTIIELIREGE